MKRHFLFLLLIIPITLITLIFGPGCANIIPPSGGPRDSLPPVLVRAEPPDSSVNFRGRTIRLHFNEFVDLQDLQQNLLFTPLFNTNPVIEAKLNTLTLRLRDSLEPNTTYVFNFGNAIKDINEGNVLHNFVYTFSTGQVLDSLTLSGKVLLAENGKIDSTLIVVLHKSITDSAVVKDRPRYVTRLDRNGNFTFKNLPGGTFALYALGDPGGGRRYLNKTQLFAFTNEPVILTDTTKSVTIYAYREVETPTTPPPTGRTATPTDRRLRFTTNLTNNQQDLLTPLNITFEQPLRSIDSSKMGLFSDSLFNRVTAYHLQLDSSRKRLTLQTAWQPGTSYHLILDRDFAEDTTGRKLLKTDTLSFTTRKEADYAQIRLRIRNLDFAQNPVLQFVQNEAVVFSVPLKGDTWSQNLFLPGDYDLRILYDQNGNGRWDPGQFFGTKRQPELVRPIERRLTVKAGSENDVEVSL
ncbi:MAG: Ig-like domain-containing protein [Flavisolibacter sp.]|nr:Ig-like domain-containing protein [Flavisolibacter sp.]